MRRRAHVRLLRPGALLLWDDLDTATEDPGVLGPVLARLGFVVPTEPIARLTAPTLRDIATALRGDDLSLSITNPQIAEPDLMSFPGVTGGPWIEQARIDGAIVVVYGRLRLGRSAVGSADLAVERGEALAATVAFSG
jgi:hypothetical protein